MTQGHTYILAAVQLLLFPACGQAVGLRGLNTVHMHHLPPLLCLRPCGQRNRTDNSTCIDHQGRVSIAPSPSVSLSVIFLSWLFFLLSPETFSVDERNHKLNIKTPRSPLNTCHLSFVQIMARVAIETALFFFFSSPILVSLSLLVRQRDRGRGKQTARDRKPQSIMSTGNDQKRAV